MQNTMEQSLVGEGLLEELTESITIDPEQGLKPKVRALLQFMSKGRLRAASIVALVDTGQTVDADGIISEVAWKTLRQPELDPDPQWVKDPTHLEQFTKEREGTACLRWNMAIQGNMK